MMLSYHSYHSTTIPHGPLGPPAPMETGLRFGKLRPWSQGRPWQDQGTGQLGLGSLAPKQKRSETHKCPWWFYGFLWPFVPNFDPYPHCSTGGRALALSLRWVASLTAIWTEAPGSSGVLKVWIFILINAKDLLYISPEGQRKRSP